MNWTPARERRFRALNNKVRRMFATAGEARRCAKLAKERREYLNERTKA